MIVLKFLSRLGHFQFLPLSVTENPATIFNDRQLKTLVISGKSWKCPGLDF